MTKGKRFPENVIPVNFKRKNPRQRSMRELYPDAFAMYVDTDSDHPDKFSQALLDTLQEQEDLIAGRGLERLDNKSLPDDDEPHE
ncbi:hypothetical protein [Desulfobacula sp.]|uniref:hypothetical protein n=1 Tax=Desulfobacula sp. TaxID=2593537 RepID=UPI002608924D|nr:hypothetical protein [Desulfobacula sp.]